MQSNQNIQYISRIIILAFVITAFTLVFWSILRADTILVRDDNPRQVDAELQIQRGRILDRNGEILAETIGSPNNLIRVYPHGQIGPAVGYYNFRYGTDGIEDSFDEILRGNNQNSWQEFKRLALHETQVGRDVQLTLDANIQSTAESLMKDYKGALILFEQTDHAANIISLVSHPGYDPNDLHTSFEMLASDEEAPLLNRITQGQYQPGLILQPFILAYAVDRGLIDLDDSVTHPNRPILLNGSATYCAHTAPESSTWEDVLSYRCPGPMKDLSESLSLIDLEDAFSQFKLNNQPSVPLNTETLTYPPLNDVKQALIGQDNLVVTPLQIGVAWLALNNNGRFLPLRLATQIQTDNGGWETIDLEFEEDAAVSKITTDTILETLPKSADILEFSTQVLSGPEGTINSWYLGSTPTGETVVIVLEGEDSLEKIELIGRELITAVQQTP